MKILWLTINSSWSHSSLALPMIHLACWDCSGWQWTSYSGTIKDDFTSVAANVSQQKPDLVCATLYIFNRPCVLEVLGRIKALSPQVKIAVGGPECLGSGAKELIARYDFIDYVCQGEGEVIMPSLLNVIMQRQSISVPGVVSRDNTEAPPQIYADWEYSPLPCTDEFYDFTKPFVQVETSRGCPNHCIFCTSAGTQVRYRSLDLVHQELSMLHRHGIREIRLLDRTFNMPPSRAIELLKMFRTDFSDMHFHLEFNPCILPQELKDELSAARTGQLHIEAGMQSMQEGVIDAIGREHTCAKAIEGLKFLCALPGVVVHSDLISGLPQQTLSGLYDDVCQMSKIGPGEIQLEVLKILKGTVLEREADSLGLRYAPDAPYDVMSTPWMNADEIIESRFLSKLVDLYYNAEALQTAFRKCLEYPGFLSDFMVYTKHHGLDLGPAPALKRRFVWLYDFLKEQNIPAAIDELRISWMKEAFGAVDICADAQLIEQLNGRMCLWTIADDNMIFHRDAKYYQLTCIDGRHLIFVYNRAVAQNKAIAIYQEN